MRKLLNLAASTTYFEGMITVKSFEFNPFAENTYVLSAEKGECIIIDPGCCNTSEYETIDAYISEQGLTPSKLINTHCHIDHVLGNHHISKKYKIDLEIHAKDVNILRSVNRYAAMYGINYTESPEPKSFLEEGMRIRVGNSTLDVVFVPGHCPGHVALISHAQKFVIGGDALFRESIGRTDLPGGNYEVLIESINTRFFKLDDDYVVHCGHGPSTTIGHEKKHNPFLHI